MKITSKNVEIRDLTVRSPLLEKKFSVLFTELKAKGVSENRLNSISLLLEKGKTIASQLSDINEPIPSSSLDDCLALVWFIKASSYEDIGDSFLRGSVRLVGLSEEQSKRFKSFFNSCPGSYNRVSSHFKEMTVGHQKGLDFPKGTLPLDDQLGTLLCGRLDDGSFFIKLERESLRFSKPKEAFKHMMNWLEHYKLKGGHQVVGNKQTRRETDGVADIKPAYDKTISSWYAVNGSKVSLSSEPKKHHRIFQMYHTVQEIHKTIQQNTSFHEHPGISDLRDSIENFTTSLEEKEISHPHIASGKEVLLQLDSYL